MHDGLNSYLPLVVLRVGVDGVHARTTVCLVAFRAEICVSLCGTRIISCPLIPTFLCKCGINLLLPSCRHDDWVILLSLFKILEMGVSIFCEDLFLYQNCNSVESTASNILCLSNTIFVFLLVVGCRFSSSLLPPPSLGGPHRRQGLKYVDDPPSTHSPIPAGRHSCAVCGAAKLAPPT